MKKGREKKENEKIFIIFEFDLRFFLSFKIMVFLEKESFFFLKNKMISMFFHVASILFSLFLSRIFFQTIFEWRVFTSLQIWFFLFFFKHENFSLLEWFVLRTWLVEETKKYLEISKEISIHVRTNVKIVF